MHRLEGARVVEFCQADGESSEGAGLDLLFGGSHVFGEVRGDVIEVEGLVNAGQVVNGFKDGVSHVLVVGVVVDVLLEVGIGDVDPDVLGGAAFGVNQLAEGFCEVGPAFIRRGVVDGGHRGDCAFVEPFERLETGGLIAGAVDVAIGQAEEVADGVSVSEELYFMAGDGGGRIDGGGRGVIGVGDKLYGELCAVFPCEVVGVGAARVSKAGAVIAGGEIYEDHLCGGPLDIAIGVGVHKELPIVFVGGEVESDGVLSPEGGIEREQEGEQQDFPD